MLHLKYQQFSGIDLSEHKTMTEVDRQCTYNVTYNVKLRSVHETTVAVGKQ